MSSENESKDLPPDCSIFEVAANLLAKPDILAALPADCIPMIKKVEHLLQGLGSGSSDRIESSLEGLGVNKESKLWIEVGHMARTLHESLRDFKSSLDRGNITMSTTNIPDATEKLESVLSMTFEAANKTMNNMERQSEILNQIKADLDAYKLRIPPTQQKDSFLSRLEKQLSSLDMIATETLVAQSYQDLTGQSIKKVIKLVADLEINLISLVKVFGVKDDPTAKNQTNTSQTNTNQTNTEQTKTAVTQDDVDSLLSSFGF